MSDPGGPGAVGPRLILASASPRRRDILRQLRLEPEIRSADVDEAYLPGESPAEHVERLARLKADTVLGELEGEGPVLGLHGGGGGADDRPASGAGAGSILVVGGDTVVVDGGSVLVKPEDEDDAVRMLLALSGGEHEVLSGLAVVSRRVLDPDVSRPDLDGEDLPRAVTGVARTVVRMRPFDAETARRYVATGEPMDKAGSYGIQGEGAALVAGIQGDYYSVVGFPVGLFLDLLDRVGWRFAFGSLTSISSTS